MQIPAGIAEGKNRYPRNADHVFRLITLDLVVESHSLTDSAVGVLLGSKIARGFLQSAKNDDAICQPRYPAAYFPIQISRTALAG